MTPKARRCASVAILYWLDCIDLQTASLLIASRRTERQSPILSVARAVLRAHPASLLQFRRASITSSNAAIVDGSGTAAGRGPAS